MKKMRLNLKKENKKKMRLDLKKENKKKMKKMRLD
jgi:hypothetical protein